MRTAGRAALAACALALGGCSYFSWFKSADENPMPLAEIRATVTPRVAWSASVGRAGGFRFFPRIEAGRVFTAAADGTVTVLDAESGRQAARFDAGRKLSSGAGGQGETIIVGTIKGEVAAYDLAGKSLWVANVGGEVLAPVVVAGATAVVRTADGRIFALGLADGKRRWVYQRPTPALLLRAETAVLVTPTNVVAGYPGGKLIALDLDDGKLTW